MKMNPNSPKYQASIRRWNTYQARKRLERKVQTCFAPDSRFYTLPLDLHRFKLTPDLLFWHWRAAFIAPLRERLSQYAPPLPLRYVYALDLYTYDTPVFYLLTDAPHAAVQAAFADFWIHGDNWLYRALRGRRRGAYRPSADRPGTRYAQKQKGICLFAAARSV